MDRSPADADVDATPGIGSDVAATYSAYHRVLARSPRGRHVHFMNFGYEPVADEPDLGRLAIPARVPAVESARLVSELVGEQPLAGARVLDVGCGRGGALWLLGRNGAGALLGVDLVPGAVTAARALLTGGPPAMVALGDAQHLPVADRAVDLVVNLESSLHYPRIEQFYAEAARVLPPGGRLLYGDLFDVDAGSAYGEALGQVGFDVVTARDVTAQVVAARRSRATRQRTALEGADRSDAARFVAEEGTAFFDALDGGRLAYRLLQCVRDARPVTVPPPDARLRRAAERAAAYTGTMRVAP